MKTRSTRPARAPARPSTPTPSAGVHARTALAVGLAALTLAHAPARADRGAIYRTTAPDGTVVFTDRPAPDAVVIETRTFDSTTPGTSPDDASGAGRGRATAAGGEEPYREEMEDAEAAFREPAVEASNGSPVPVAALPVTPDAFASATDGEIDRVEIASPPPDATLVDPAGPLLVEVGTAPGSLAASGLVAQALIDGDVVASGESSTLAVPPLERGEHRLQVRLVDVDGGVVVESTTQALHVRRGTVANAADEDR